MNNANLYSSSNSLQRRDAESVIKEFLPKMSWKRANNKQGNVDNLGGGELVLDVGCGSGDVTKELLMPAVGKSLSSSSSGGKNKNKQNKFGNRHNIVGVDISGDMIDYAKRYVRCQIQIKTSLTILDFFLHVAPIPRPVCPSPRWTSPARSPGTS